MASRYDKAQGIILKTKKQKRIELFVGGDKLSHYVW